MVITGEKSSLYIIIIYYAILTNTEDYHHLKRSMPDEDQDEDFKKGKRRYFCIFLFCLTEYFKPYISVTIRSE